MDYMDTVHKYSPPNPKISENCFSWGKGRGNPTTRAGSSLLGVTRLIGSNNNNMIMGQTNFRKISIVPTFEELVQSKEVTLKPNIIKGPFDSIDQYLDIHFRLFREDYVSPLRKAIQCLRKNPRFTPDDVRVYKNVCLMTPIPIMQKYDREEQNEKCFCEADFHLVCFDPDNRDIQSKKTVDDLVQSKMFMVGSLLCFTNDSFQSLQFATVKCRERKHLSRSQVAVKFCKPLVGGVFGKFSYLMIESEAFFEPYYQVLKALQEMDEDNFPFPQYIIKVQKEDALPKYLRNRKYVPISISGIAEDYKFNILDETAWPSAAQLGVNSSQFRALKASLTKELAVIQGPPGTGKTFMAMKITEILVRNKEIMNRRAPILVVCMTNHALDQFLLGVLNFTNSILRFGGQSKCRELDNYNSSKLVKDARMMIARGKEVIGLTTTGAARARSMLQELCCEIVIVEEAAEILEAHVVASVTKCQHLILIGDHKQLQPKIADHTLMNYNLNISIFERMVMNRDKCATLNVQHRMAPEMTKLIVPLIYKSLKDHESVLMKPVPKSLVKRVSFVNHNMPESQFKNGHSKMNEYEANFLVALCKHLLKQDDYTSEDITILTTYKGQMLHIKDVIKNDNSEQACELADVRVAVVDDYQGEECNIILLSLVRSNPDGVVGFLFNENRVNVALSRAKNVFVMVGNMNTLVSQSKSLEVDQEIS